MPDQSRSGGGNGEFHSRLVARLRDQADDLRRLASGLDEPALSHRPVPENWSIKELLCHLWRLQEVFEMRIEAMLTEDKPVFSPYAQDNDPEFAEKLQNSSAALLEGMLSDREQLLALLDSLRPSDWRKHGIHPEYPHYDIQFSVEYLIHHEAHHIFQMFQRRPIGPRLACDQS